MYYYKILIIFGLGTLVSHAAMIMDADDFEHDTIGSLPFKATASNPITSSGDVYISVIDPSANTAGTGNGVHLFDNNTGIGLQLEYDFTIIADIAPQDIIDYAARLSAVKVDLSFAPQKTNGEGNNYFKITLGEHFVSQSNSNTHFLDCRLSDDGTIHFLSGSGPESTGHTLTVTGNELSIYVNDYDSASITYQGTDGLQYSLPPNSVAYWLNGDRISFGGQGYTRLENRATKNGLIIDSSNNLGRFAIVSSADSSGLDYIFDDIKIFDLDSEQVPTGKSSLVSNSLNGLIYNGYANQGQSNAVNKVPDYSNAGYAGGGVPIPFVPAVVTVSPSGDTSGSTDADNIQNAINQVSNLPIGENGFRGAVKLTAGNYTVSRTLVINSSGIVIRGAGSQEKGGTRIYFNLVSSNKPDLFLVDGNAGSPAEVNGTRTMITDAYVPVGARHLNVSDATIYSPGDSIIIQMMVNDQWLTDLGMGANAPGNPMGSEAWTKGYFQNIKYRRTITAIEGNTISIDAPTLQTIESLYGGAEVYKYSYPNGLKNVGIECLRLESAYASETDEDHGWDAIQLENLEDGWVRQVTARYFVYSLVNITNHCRRITVEDCANFDAVCTSASGRRYSFSVDESDSILWQRCLTRNGRHDFASGSRVQGPNVFVDCRATETYNDIGPHHRYSTGQLYDNIFGGEMNVQNRLQSGSGHGWSGAQIMFWNCDASSIVADAPNGAMNWVVGSSAYKAESRRTPDEPFGIWDSLNQAVTPRSLYYAQLADRLGANALNNVILPQQKKGNIWTELFLWDGDGLFLDDVITWAEEEITAKTDVPVQIGGTIRNLQMLDRGGLTYLWSKVSGPGSVSFADNTALETSAIFSQKGSYVLNLLVDDGTNQASANLEMDVYSAADIPKAPTNLTATASDSSVFLNWNDNGESDLKKYTVYRSVTSATGYTAIDAHVSLSEYTDSSVINNMTYFYVVTATDSDADESSWSNEVSATPLPDTTPPQAPTGLSAIAGDNSVFLDWEDNAESDFQRYAVFRRLASDVNYTALDTNVTLSEFEDTSVTNQIRYFYAVEAIDDKGNKSPKSSEVSAFPSEPEILYSISYGANNDGSGGFITSTASSAEETWTVEAESLRYTNDSTNTTNSSLLRDFTLDRSGGKSYIIKGIFNPTGGYADDNNRVGLYLFGSFADITGTGGPGENELGALCLLYNFDTGQLRLHEGIDRRLLASVSTNPTRAEDNSIFDPENILTLTANVSFNESGEILIEGSFEDENSNITSLIWTVAATDYDGSYFGFVTRARNRGIDDSDRNATFIIDYKNFSILDARPTSDQNSIDDSWEQFYFGTTGIDENGDPDNDGSPNFFEYLYGSDPTDPTSRGVQVQIATASNGNVIALSWAVKDGFILGNHYQMKVSTTLNDWNVLPEEHYSLTENIANGKSEIEMTLTHDYGSKVFFRLTSPEL